jgi:hypothetical protein
MNAGKDVYRGKPMVQQISDGKDVIETTGRIMQVGSQRVSSVIYHKAKELLVDRDSALGAWQYSIPPDASPSTVDWDRFLGRAQITVRAYAPVLLAQLPGLQLRHARRSFRSSDHRAAFRAGFDRPHPSTPPADCASGRMAATFRTSWWPCTTTQPAENFPRST